MNTLHFIQSLFDDEEPREPEPVKEITYLLAWAKWTSEMSEHYPATDMLRTIWVAAEAVVEAAMAEHLATFHATKDRTSHSHD